MKWLLRLSRLARNPPSQKRVRMLLIVVALCLIIYGIEAAGFWPDWAKSTPVRR